MRQHFQRQGHPIISVDAKKQELVGNFKNAGAQWPSPEQVNHHDFPSLASGKTIPYRVCDVQANRASGFVGVSHDTSATPSPPSAPGGAGKAVIAMHRPESC
jgi:hypothetical protein